MGLFSSSTSPSPQPSATPTCTSSQRGGASLRSRNAFINFLREYRQQYQPSSPDIPFWRMVMEAAERWNRMALREKYRYIEAAHRTDYIYRARDRHFNRVMRLLRKALSAESEVNLKHLASAVKQMQLWKRKTLKDIL